MLYSLRDGGKNILCTCFQKLCYMCTLIMFGMIYFCIHAGQFYQCLVWLSKRKSAFYFTSVKRRVRAVLAYRKSIPQLCSLISGTSVSIFLLHSSSAIVFVKSLNLGLFKLYFCFAFQPVQNFQSFTKTFHAVQTLSQTFLTLLVSPLHWTQIILLLGLFICRLHLSSPLEQPLSFFSLATET